LERCVKKNIEILFILCSLILIVGKIIAININDISCENISKLLEIKCESNFHFSEQWERGGILSRSLKKLCKEIDK
ncbi:hypothetical protein ACUNER_25025, partial [Serratia sp. IR-2025]